MAILPKEKLQRDTQYREIMFGQEAVAVLMRYMASEKPVDAAKKLRASGWAFDLQSGGKVYDDGRKESAVIDASYGATAEALAGVSSDDAQKISEEPFQSLADIHAFITQVISNPKVIESFPAVADLRFTAKQITDPQKQGEVEKLEDGSYALNFVKADGRWPRPVVVVHEIAHIVCPEEFQPHGPAFVRAFLELVEITLGSTVRTLLDIQFKERGVSGA